MKSILLNFKTWFYLIFNRHDVTAKRIRNKNFQLLTIVGWMKYFNRFWIKKFCKNIDRIRLMCWTATRSHSFTARTEFYMAKCHSLMTPNPRPSELHITMWSRVDTHESVTINFWSPLYSYINPSFFETFHFWRMC